MSDFFLSNIQHNDFYQMQSNTKHSQLTRSASKILSRRVQTKWLPAPWLLIV